MGDVIHFEHPDHRKAWEDRLLAELGPGFPPEAQNRFIAAMRAHAEACTEDQALKHPAASLPGWSIAEIREASVDLIRTQLFTQHVKSEAEAYRRELK